MRLRLSLAPKDRLRHLNRLLRTLDVRLEDLGDISGFGALFGMIVDAGDVLRPFLCVLKGTHLQRGGVQDEGIVHYDTRGDNRRRALVVRIRLCLAQGHAHHVRRGAEDVDALPRFFILLKEIA